MQKVTGTSPNNINLAFLWLGHASFIVLFIFSVYFFRERVLFSDTAFQFFKIVNFEKINIEASRYGAIIPQLPVILAMKLGASLKGLTILYSVSFILIYYIVFLTCVYLLKNLAAGLSVIFVLILCISQSFFHPVTETHQSLAYSALFYAILQYSGFRHKIAQLLLATAVMILSFLAHPVALYPTIFIIGYVAIDKKQLRSFEPYFLFLMIGGLAIAKVFLTNENSYEGRFFSELLNSPSIILDLPFVYSTKFFFKRIPGLYFWLVIFELALIVYFILKKEHVKLAWQLVSSFFFFIITLLTYNQGDADMMMERAFMPLALFTAIPFLKEIVERNDKNKFIKIAFLTLVIIASFIRIHSQGERFRERTRLSEQVLSKTAQLPNRKFIVDKNELSEKFPVSWAHSFETLILSKITKDMPTQTIFPANDLTKLSKYNQDVNDVFLGADFWLEWRINDINPKYFDLPTNYPYKIIKISEL